MDFELTIQALTKKWKYINKILGFICAGLLAAFGILNFDFSGPINLIILQIYYIVFGIIIVITECGMKSITKMFGFLGNLFGKGLFMILIGLSMFKGGEFELKSLIAIALLFCGVIYIGLYSVPKSITSDPSSEYEDKQANK